MCLVHTARHPSDFPLDVGTWSNTSCSQLSVGGPAGEALASEHDGSVKVPLPCVGPPQARRLADVPGEPRGAGKARVRGELLPSSCRPSSPRPLDFLLTVISGSPFPGLVPSWSWGAPPPQLHVHVCLLELGKAKGCLCPLTAVNMLSP